MSSFRFVLGPSGSGKTTEIYKYLLREAAENPKRNYLIIVPDQFTMQTQWDLAMESKDGGILNIDVLSFGRLTHRILSEVGWDELPVLDDTGKCLVLQRVAGQIEKELPLLGAKLGRQGYVHEVKSIISEFLQYGVSPEDIDVLAEASSEKGILVSKLRDLSRLYRAYEDYISGKFISREEKLSVLCEAMPYSAILPDACVVFDGFTGFTPIQLQVIEVIMGIARETVFSLVLGAETTLAENNEQQKLFYLSYRTAEVIRRCAKNSGCEEQEPLICSRSFRRKNLSLLEKHIFRSGMYLPEGKDYERTGALNNENKYSYPGITLMKMSTQREEVRQTGLKILELLRERKELKYGNICIVTGDLEEYAPYVEREFTKLGIPYYLDRTNSIRLNPVVEAARSGISVLLEDFSADSVFRFLRCGIAPLTDEETDELEMYVMNTGIRGYRKWSERFTRRTDRMKAGDESELIKLNALRERFMSSISVLCGDKSRTGKDTASKHVRRLYDFLQGIDAAGKAEEKRKNFDNEGNPVKAREYSQIYRKVMELLEQINNLIGEDSINLREFSEILDAGFGEIRVGTIPATVDRIMVGDIERSRITSVDTMFLLGANDGYIPGNAGSGGLLSELDREFLSSPDTKGSIELAPTPREEMFTQRLYLYMNLTKPVNNLFVSYAELDGEGKAQRPSYLISAFNKLFPEIELEMPEKRPVTDQLFERTEALEMVGDLLRRYAEKDSVSSLDNERKELFTILSTYEGYDEKCRLDALKRAAFAKYDGKSIAEDLSKKLYCNEKGELKTSVSKLETYTECPYKFFLKYGLKLEERNDFEIGSIDTGNIFHYVIKKFYTSMKEDGKSWKSVDEGYINEKVGSILDDETASYNSAVFYDTKRNEYSIRRMKRALVTSLIGIKYQMNCGGFEQYGAEQSFFSEMEITDSCEKPEKSDLGDKKAGKLVLSGSIDRVDLAQNGEDKWFRIVDYKSSEHELKLSEVCDGGSLQLPLYMNRELELLKKAHPGENVKGAGLFYFTIDAPLVEEDGELDDEELRTELLGSMRMNGYSCSEEEALKMMDTGYALARKDGNVGFNSLAVPLVLTKKGEFGRGTKVLSSEEIELMSEYCGKKAGKIGNRILSGDISVNPTEGNACKYCPYKPSCEFDRKISGYEKRIPEKMTDEEALGRMREELSDKGENKQ